MPGRDVAGTVVAVGSAVTRFAVGDEVFGVAPRLVRRVRRGPRGQAGPQAGQPDLRAGRRRAGLRRSPPCRRCATPAGSQPGQTVLVIGASGGVGSYAVQLAKALGAEVTGVASTAKLDLVRSLGADHVVDYTREDFADGAHRYDLILDIAGNPTLSRLRRALTPTGTAVIVGGEEGGSFTGGMNRQLRALALSLFVRQRLTMFVSQGARQRPRAAHRAHRGRPGHPEHRPDLPAEPRRPTPCATSRPARSAARSPSR